MNAVEVSLRKTILELQNLSSVAHFSLGGGTNLALRYGHRISVDIDLVCAGPERSLFNPPHGSLLADRSGQMA